MGQREKLERKAEHWRYEVAAMRGERDFYADEDEWIEGMGSRLEKLHRVEAKLAAIA